MRSGIPHSVSASGDAELDDEVTKTTKEELEAKWPLGRRPRGRALPAWMWLPTPRFGIQQGQERSLRFIDDCPSKASTTERRWRRKLMLAALTSLSALLVVCSRLNRPRSSHSRSVTGRSCGGGVHPEWIAEGLWVKGAASGISRRLTANLPRTRHMRASL